MSHIVRIELEIKDLDALKIAAKHLGLEFMEGQTAYKWFGHFVGDYPLPEGFTVKDLGHCEHVLRVKGNVDAYEIGIVRRRDGRPGYTLLFDFWNRGYGLEDVIGSKGSRFKQEYAAAVTQKAYQKQGYRVNRLGVRTDGKVVLQATK